MTNPYLISTPFSDAGDKQNILDSAPVDPNDPTWVAGFPAITSTPIAEGGLPPKRISFNGVLNAITQNIVHQSKGLMYEFDAAYAAKIGGYPLSSTLSLSNGDVVKSIIAGNSSNPNLDMTGWVNETQTATRSINSVADFNTTPVYLGNIYQTKSYYADGSGAGWRYKYDGTIAKNKHNGGTIIDPSVVFTTLSDFLAEKTTSGYGCFVALNIEREIPVEIFGARPLASFVENDIPINATIRVASATSASEPPRIVTIGSGEYRTSNAIVNTSLWHIVPPHIKGAGREATKIIKVTNSALGVGYLADQSVDAVLVSSPLADNPEGGSAYLISESVKGLSLKRTTETTSSVGWYRHRSAMGYVDDIYSESQNTHFVFNDCWMTNFGQLWANGGTHGYKFNVATSLSGGWLYATAVQDVAFLFDKVIYSDIKCCADGCGLVGTTGAAAYKFVDCRGVSGKFNAEGHRGELFSFSGSYGMVISGQDWRAKPVSANALRMYFSYASVKFVGYDFLESATSLTASERQQYEFYEKDSISVVDFDVVSMPQQPYGSSNKKPIISILSDNSAFFAKYVDARYIQNGRHVLHNLSLTTSWKMLCYVGESSRVRLQSANSTDPAQPYFVYVDNTINREVGIKVASISTNSGSPTELATIYVDDDKNPTYSTKLQGYIASNGWLYVKAAGGGFGLNYCFNLML